ncbi:MULTISPECIES: glycerate kinase [unclassified Beijerinckia]|uniref:glycerate kinase type-2 family protein n=1 Tax=unclassified Beijerinckia TaxID=2638183 RepID=UPI00089CB199|nr:MULTISPECIES: glycerate kinase [unclassified Beijerinckia]MDH7798545.1 glycerate 2-kinase [Beijerinckia sp. GAS462]SED24455.1 glycerate 2-kinase [Beijerinckia sp. 28-YEA-48]
MTGRRALLETMFRAAIAAADPALAIPRHLPSAPRGRTIVIGAGKAAASMAKAVEDHWPGPLEGLVVTRYGHGAPCQRIEVVEAAHPVPDAAGRAAAGRILDKVQGLSPDDLVLCLISGGGSALLSLPIDGLTFEAKQAINSALLKSGAPIGEMNIVRKHLSAIKGGRLAAAAWPAQVVSLIISDVPGDDPAVVASGPTIADPSTSAQALEILQRYGIAVPEAVAQRLARGEDETPKPGDPRLARVQTHVIATAQLSLDAAAEIARQAGLKPVILGDAIEGEARDVGREHAALALHVTQEARPCALLSGGETTVTVRGTGRGGRNAEYLLALALALKGRAGIHALAGDTDGIDGVEASAGALVAPDTLQRAAALGLNAQAMLDNNDAWTFFSTLDDLVVTGPTLTNVNDFRCTIIE